ncbi:MAG: hypothetical protein SVX43_19915 [Cyanobacteriota bacterium]|nr:hypothetical protein [Cyanobacteriota bacterium]
MAEVKLTFKIFGIAGMGQRDRALDLLNQALILVEYQSLPSARP